MKLEAGRNFSRDFGTDATAAYIVNHTAAGKFGWTAEQSVGKALRFAEGRPGTIIGVIEDFHFQPLNRTIEPLALMLEDQALAFASIKLDGVDIAGAVDFVREKWTALEPGREFESYFVDDDFAARYSSEERLSRILTAFALLAIFIACLGLFGLASYTAVQRTREIGIRRVLGASVNGIVALLSREFMKWVLAANLAAWPTTYLVMRNLWLADFPYRAGLPWTLFLIAGGSSLVIALLTVGFQVIRAASADPAVSLRYE
jgi:putative ABC transport system permease protein